MKSPVATIISLVKSYKMAVSFKLNNNDFSLSPFPSVSENVSSKFVLLSFIYARKPFPSSINIWSSKPFAIATKTLTSSVPRILQGNFFPKLILNLSKSSIPDPCNIPINHNHWSICKSVLSFEPVVVNVNVVSVPVSSFSHSQICFSSSACFFFGKTLILDCKHCQ